MSTIVNAAPMPILRGTDDQSTRALVPEVLAWGGEFAVVRPRVEVDELIALDRIPGWLA